MKQIYTARNDMEAHFVKSLLDAEDIHVVIQGEALEGAWGDVPVSAQSVPTLWVEDEDTARAEAIVAEYELREKTRPSDDESDEPSTTTWKCPKCGEEVEDQFDKCWNCGTERPGSEGTETAEAKPQPE